jgi:hypothetical protein
MDPDSVADPGFLSRILIFTHPGSWNSVPKTALKDRGEKKLVVIPFFGAINFTKLSYTIFKMLKKQIWANFQIIIKLFTSVADSDSDPNPDPHFFGPPEFQLFCDSF